MTSLRPKVSVPWANLKALEDKCYFSIKIRGNDDAELIRKVITAEHNS
jgi:hypothetical protein